MLMRMLTNANHVESFPAASRWMITCLAAVGCFHHLLIMIEESACVWFASTMSVHFLFLVRFRP